MGLCVLPVNTGSWGRLDCTPWAQDLVLALGFQLCLKNSEKILNEPPEHLSLCSSVRSSLIQGVDYGQAVCCLFACMCGL